MSRKIAHVIIVGVLGLYLVACSAATPTSMTPTPNQPPVIANTPEPGALAISSTNAFVDTYGAYRVVGMLVNQSSNVLTSIELAIEIKDTSGNSLLKDNGNPVANAKFHPMLYTLAPGESSPFEYSYDTANGIPASYSVKISSLKSGDANRANLTAENVQLIDNGSGWYYLTGSLVNKGNQWARINDLAGAILDPSNNVLSADWSATYATELAPTGDSSGADRTPFEINFPKPGGSVTPPWSLYWDADVVDNASTYPVTVVITNGYLDQYGSQHIVGWVTNNSDKPLNTLVVAGLYAQNGNVLDSGFSYLPIPVKASASVPFSVSSFNNVDYNPAQAALVRTFSAQVDPGSTNPPNDEYVELKASGETVQKDGAIWTINGSITNTSDKNLGSATVIVSVLDNQNNLVAMEFTTVFSSGAAIAAGETDTYSVSISLDPNIDSTGFTVTTTATGDVSQ